MKNRFKKLFTTLIASFALSSCANFLPQLPSSRLSSNETSKEAFSNSQNNATSNSSSFNDEISSVINRHSSDITDSDTTSSENHISSNVYASSENADISSSSQTYSSSASIDDRFPIDDDYCIHAYDGFPRGKVDNQYFTRFEMLHSVDGENVPLDASSCSATTDDEGLSIYTSVTNGSKSYLEVTLLGRTESLFTFNVNLKARNGVTLTREYKLPVTYDMESTDIFVSYDSYRYLSYAYGDTIIFEECHKNTNNHTLTFDSDRPYDIGYYDESKIEITGFSLEDNDTRLGVKIKPLVCYCEGYIDLKLIFSNGDTQNVKQFYYVDPPYNFEPQDGVVIAYDQTEEFTFSFRDFKDARHQAEFDATDVHYFCSGGITCELVNITNTSLTFSISNTGRSDYSFLYLVIPTILCPLVSLLFHMNLIMVLSGGNVTL